MPSTPETCASMGAATVSCTVLALAPGYNAVTCTVGGVTSGYCATGNVHTATNPASVMTTEITVAKIGRSMKKRENTYRLHGSLVPSTGFGASPASRGVHPHGV